MAHESAPIGLRDIRILQGLAQGKTDREIAEALEVSVRTVNCHMRRLCEQLLARNRTQAVVNAIRLGYICPEE
jgi:two-component system response regulator DegU